MPHPKDVGDHATLAVALALHATGRRVLLPFGENVRYDLAIDGGGAIERVQCKSAVLHDGVVWFRTTSAYGHHRSPRQLRRGYVGEIDYFGVFCPATAGVYLVPVGDVPSRSEAALRTAPPRNGQRRRIRFAAPYLVTEVRLGT